MKPQLAPLASKPLVGLTVPVVQATARTLRLAGIPTAQPVAPGLATRPAVPPHCLLRVPVRPRVPSHAARAAQPPCLHPEEMRAAQAAGASELTTEARLKAELLVAPSAAVVAAGAVQAAAAREECQMKVPFRRTVVVAAAYSELC